MGRVEIGGVYSICPLSLSVHHNIARDGERGRVGTPPPSPEWADITIMMEYNIPQNVVIATLSVLCV
jgi:hypothetical protein